LHIGQAHRASTSGKHIGYGVADRCAGSALADAYSDVFSFYSFFLVECRHGPSAMVPAIRNFDAGITDARNGKLTLTLLINP
jgi:hypothetical protein